MIASHLYVPADQPRLVAKGLARRAGALILDLEDAVAPSRKQDARVAVASALEQGSQGASLWVRINSGPEGLADAEALSRAPRLPDGIWIAKAEDPSHVQGVASAFAGAGDLPALGLLIESARGLLGLSGLIASADVHQIQLGEIDLAADLGHPARTDEGMWWARHWVVVHSRAHGLLPPVAPVNADYRDLDGFRTTSLRLLGMGFGSRACIHPGQAEIADQVFAPTGEDLAAANLLVDEYEAMVRQGRGAFADARGTMADAATVRQARRLTGR